MRALSLSSVPSARDLALHTSLVGIDLSPARGISFMKVLLVTIRFRNSDSIDANHAFIISGGCRSTAWKVVGSGRNNDTGWLSGLLAAVASADSVGFGSVSNASRNAA